MTSRILASALLAALSLVVSSTAANDPSRATRLTTRHLDIAATSKLAEANRKLETTICDRLIAVLDESAKGYWSGWKMSWRVETCPGDDGTGFISVECSSRSNNKEVYMGSMLINLRYVDGQWTYAGMGAAGGLCKLYAHLEIEFAVDMIDFPKLVIQDPPHGAALPGTRTIFEP